MARPSQEDYTDPALVAERMKGVAVPQKSIAEGQVFDLTFDNDETLEQKESKIALAAKIKDYSEFFMMKAIGQIYTEGQWFTKWIVKDGERVSVPGDYEDEIAYMDHLVKITGYTRRYLLFLVGVYRVYKKHESYLKSIGYDAVGSINKLQYLEKAMAMVETDELTKPQLKKLLISGSFADLQDVVSRRAIAVNADDFEVDPNATVKMKGNILMIDNEPMFEILGSDSDSLRKSLMSFLQAEKRKSELGESFRTTVDFYNTRLVSAVASDKIPVVIPVDSDVADVKAFERAASKVMTQFYKDWKTQH